MVRINLEAWDHHFQTLWRLCWSFKTGKLAYEEIQDSSGNLYPRDTKSSQHKILRKHKGFFAARTTFCEAQVFLWLWLFSLSSPFWPFSYFSSQMTSKPAIWRFIPFSAHHTLIWIKSKVKTKTSATKNMYKIGNISWVFEHL